MAVTKYLRQADSIIAYVDSVADLLVKAQEELHCQFRKPCITNWNLLSVWFDKRKKCLFARYGAGDNIYFTTDSKDIRRESGYIYCDEKRGFSADQIIYDIMNNWSSIKSDIQRIIERSKACESFTA